MAHAKEKLITEYIIVNQERFYRLAFSYLHNREDALDAVQSAVCKALQKQNELKNTDAVATWFYRILVNICVDQLRKNKRVVLFAPEDLNMGSYEDPHPEDEDLGRQVDALAPEVQTVIKLRFYEDLSLREISQITGWNLSTVKNRLYGGLQKLRISVKGEAL